ncbi:hypothetical protein BWL13_00635 [Microbacterium oleivorans]|uniref:Uncharacterized protein n=2 Tax=Microbacterium oleivorans TaxID=273677 RepID=A0A031FUW1_9MICO|nr:hypothetical protein BWL13_00635 [Microbacterium oleivorans]EZP28072.1 hypothetical protein BW34_01046 [Microbacterium oleivorans]
MRWRARADWLAGMDAAELILALVLAVLVNVVILCFVIEAAVKNALADDRVFQSKVRAPRDASPIQSRRVGGRPT